MRKLNIENYKIKVKVNEVDPETNRIKVLIKENDYNFKDSLIFLMFQRELQLAGKGLLEQNILAEKILKAEKEIILEEVDYSKLKKAIESFKGATRNEVELVRRVLECPKIEVEEKK